MTCPVPDYQTRVAPFFASLPADETILIPLYEAFRASSEALVGILNQPRFRNTEAEDRLDEEIERADDRACAIAEKLSQLSHIISEEWRSAYVETIVSHALFCGANIDEILKSLTAARSVPVRAVKLRALAS